MRNNNISRGRPSGKKKKGIWTRELLVWLEKKVEQALAPCPGQEEEQDEVD